ncbi:N-acetyltransferase domain-containing protein [Gammaproteobacteria bacterium]
MMKVQPLTGNHDRSRFDCGHEALNLWLRQTALQHQAKGISRTFVAVPMGLDAMAQYRLRGYGNIEVNSILGFFALASALVWADDLAPELTKRYPRQIPVTRLGRLAVRADLQGQGLGRLLLADAVTRSRNAALLVGSSGIFVDAKDDMAARFYAGYGFTACRDQPLKLFLPLW